MSIHNSLKSYIQKSLVRMNQRKQTKGLIPAQKTKEATVAELNKLSAELYEKVLQFIEDNNEMCAIWHSPECKAAREIEDFYHGGVSIYEVDCIDGRLPRAYEGEADSMKTEKAQIALSCVESDKQLIPLQADICNVLSDTSLEPLEISRAHYDSTDPHHGCAAISMVLENLDNKEESVWQFLNPAEINLVTQARSFSNEEANLVLLELTNLRAFTNFHNDVRAEDNLALLPKAGVTVAYDTRTMGVELRSPLLRNDPTTQGLVYIEPTKRQVLKTADFANQLKGVLKDNKDFPKFGAFRNKFTEPKEFKLYSQEVTRLAVALFDGTLQKAKIITKSVKSFLKTNYPDLSTLQQRALAFQLFRAISHQYLTGLSEYQKTHPFSDHGERFISISKDAARMVGRYLTKYQTFQNSCPDVATGAKRCEISALVMDKTKVDQDLIHVLFISTSISKDDFENRSDTNHKQKYRRIINDHQELFRALISESRIKKRVTIGNILPVGVLLDSLTSEVLEVVEDNYLFI